MDTMASRYHLLPSQILSKADSLDVLVLDTAIQFHNAQVKKAQQKSEGNKPITPDLPSEQLTKMLNKVRGKTADSLGK